MKELILDLRAVNKEGEESWADCPEKAKIENALLDCAGQVIRVKITEIKRYASKKSWWAERK